MRHVQRVRKLQWRTTAFAASRCSPSIDANSVLRRVPALSNDLAVWRWQDISGAIDVSFSDVPQAFLNLNVEEDFRNWEARHRD